MRDPKRIPQFLKRLEKVWKKHPDMRLGQLLGNAYHSPIPGDTEQYYAEDEVLLGKLETYYKDK